MNTSGTGGALIGRLNSGSQTSHFKNIVNNAMVTSTTQSTSDSAAGLIGNAQSPVSLERCFNQGTVKGLRGVGGLIGRSAAGMTITLSKNTADIVGQRFVGGLAGYAADGKITESFNSGNIGGSESNIMYIGGLVGAILSGESRTQTIENCFNAGVINGATTGSFTAYIGGLLGNIISPKGTETITVKYCYSAESNHRVPIPKLNTSNRTFDNLYFISDTADANGYAVNLTEEMLKGIDIPSDIPSGIWFIRKEGYPYPQLIHNPYGSEGEI